MYTNKIVCLGDGFATGHIWPEWPQILQALMPEYNVSEISGIGAGSEFLVSELVLCKDIKDAHVAFQWPIASRFDKLLEDNSWASLIANDSVYSENIKNSADRKWWLSSASVTTPIKQYHEFYIQKKQANLRHDVYKTLVTAFLNERNCNFVFTSTSEQDRFSNDIRFNQVRQDQIQPSPIVHFYFLTEIILPKLGLIPDPSRTELLRNLIYSTKWRPYHPDRNHIWDQLLNKLNA